MRLIVLLIGLVFIACNSSSDKKCSSNFSETVKYKKDKFSKVVENDSVLILRDKGYDDGNVAGEYIFYKSGILKEYKFFASSNNYTYGEFYDFNGLLTKIEGNPLLATNMEEISYDSICIKFYVSTFLKEILSFDVYINGIEPRDLISVKDSALSDVNRYLVCLNTSTSKSVKIIQKLKYVNCLGDQKEVVDSTFFNRVQ